MGNLTQINWYKKLRELNPRLKVCQFENSGHFPGVYYTSQLDGIVDVCATDVGYVPPHPEFDARGNIVKVGYRRVVFILLHLHLTTRDKVKKVFGGGFFEWRAPFLSKVQTASVHERWSAMMREERKRLNILGDAKQVDVQDPIVDKMKRMEMENHDRRGSAALSGDQFVELADDVKDNMTPEQRKNLDEAKFNYDRAVGRRKVIDVN